MKDQRKFYKGRLILAFLLTNLIFTIIFLTSFSVSYINYQGISAQNNIINQYIAELNPYTNISNCNNSILFDASEKLDSVGSRISLIETRFGKDDSRVVEQKLLYSDLESRHYEIVKELNKKCNKNFTTILFFYSNEDQFDEESEKAGYILGAFKNRYPEKIMIYSFDYDINYPIINKLKEKYKINAVPSVLINEKDIVIVKNIRDLERYS